MKNTFLVIAASLVLSGCGAIYSSPNVSKDPALVDVIPASRAAIQSANQVPYTPRRLPAAFKTTTQRSGLDAALVDLPEPSLDLETRPAPPQTSVPPAVNPGPYRIGVADVILLATPTPTSTEALTGLLAAQNKRQGYTVQDDGAIAVPDVGRVVLAGLTIEEAENAVFRALVDKQIDPTFSLEIAEFNSQAVSVAGAVRNPVTAPLGLRALNLQNALQAAGGLLVEDDEYATVRITRDGQIYQIAVQEYRANPELQNVRLIDGDAVFVDQDFDQARAAEYVQQQLALNAARSQARAQRVSEINQLNADRRAANEEARQNFLRRLDLGAVKRDYAYVVGEVVNQGRFALPFETRASVADALYENGGVPSSTGDVGQIYLLRLQGEGQPIKSYHFDGRQIDKLVLATELELRPNDFVFVAEQPVTSWNRVITQILPSAQLVAAARSAAR